MDRSNNLPLPQYPSDPGDRTGPPYEAPNHRIGADGNLARSVPERNRADLLLFLGIVSLLMCGPLGFVPWIMANSDLKGIRAGRMPDRRAGTLRAARALGIGGALIFFFSLGVAVTVLQRGFDPRTEGIGWPELLRGPTPIPAEKIVFAGEWMGHKGSFIRINADGTGDFRTRQTRLQSGRVTIDERSISIGTSEKPKVWIIEQVPAMKNGTWTMKLNGEIFRRRDRGLTVEHTSEPVRKWDRKRRS